MGFGDEIPKRGLGWQPHRTLMRSIKNGSQGAKRPLTLNQSVFTYPEQPKTPNKRIVVSEQDVKHPAIETCHTRKTAGLSLKLRPAVLVFYASMKANGFTSGHASFPALFLLFAATSTLISPVPFVRHRRRQRPEAPRRIRQRQNPQRASWSAF